MTNPLPTLSNIPNPFPRSQPDWGAFQAVLNQWKTTLGPPKWQAPTLLNGWLPYNATHSPAGYFADLTGRVWLRGLLKSGASGTVAFQLPVVPAYAVVIGITCLTGGGYVGGEVDIDTSGNVSLWYTGTLSWFTLDGLSFSLGA